MVLALRAPGCHLGNGGLRVLVLPSQARRERFHFAEGQCIGGNPLNCDDGNACLTDGCDPMSGCTHVSNTDTCSDGNACTANDMCASGTCIGGMALVCADANQ